MFYDVEIQNAAQGINGKPYLWVVWQGRSDSDGALHQPHLIWSARPLTRMVFLNYLTSIEIKIAVQEISNNKQFLNLRANLLLFPRHILIKITFQYSWWNFPISLTRIDHSIYVDIMFFLQICCYNYRITKPITRI